MKNYIFLILLLIVSVNLRSQADTLLQVDTGSTVLECKYDTVYKLYIEDKERQVNHLWKWSLVDVFMGFANLSVNFGFEQKIGTFFSSNTFVSHYYGDRLPYSNFFQVDIDNGEGLYLEQQFRYFWNYNHRKKKRKKDKWFFW